MHLLVNEAVVVGLVITVLYMAKRWSSDRAENSALRNQIASLKRQLVRLRRVG